MRRLSVSDLGAFQAYRHDEEVGRYQGWLPQPDSEALDFLRKMGSIEFLRNGEWTQLGIARIETPEKLIGDLALYIASDRSKAEIGFSLSREHQGQGLGTEAVGLALEMLWRLTPVQRVEATTDAKNTASARLLERIGMKRTRVLDTEFRGQPCVEWVYTLQRPTRV